MNALTTDVVICRECGYSHQPWVSHSEPTDNFKNMPSRASGDSVFSSVATGRGLITSLQ